MRQKLSIFIITFLAGICLCTSGFAASPYQFVSTQGNRFIWDQEANSGISFPSGFSFDPNYLPIGISVSSESMLVELIPQTFPNHEESFWNFAYYSTSKIDSTDSLKNVKTKTVQRDNHRILCITFERQKLLHESQYFQYHLLAFIERGPYQGDLLTIRSSTPVNLETALSFYRSGQSLDLNRVANPSARLASPISRSADVAEALLPVTDGALPLWGIFDPSAPQNLSNVRRLEQELNVKFPLILRYTNFADSYNQLSRDMKTAKSDHRIVELTLQTNEDNRLESSVYAVLNGQYDEQIRALARVVKDQGEPVLFRLNNEMNGDWCNYSALHYGLETRLYKDVWNWIYQVFQEEGASNARWIFNPNERSFPNYRWNHMLAYLPPADQIHAIGLTGYNTGTYYSGENWRSFREIYQPIYDEYLQVFDYPFLITEFSSSSVGGSKSAWIQEMFDDLRHFPELEGLIWWNYADYDRNGKIARPYFIDETPEVMRAFKEGMQAYENRP